MMATTPCRVSMTLTQPEEDGLFNKCILKKQLIEWFVLEEPLGVDGFGIKTPKQIPLIFIRLQVLCEPEIVAIHSVVKEQELAGPTSKCCDT